MKMSKELFIELTELMTETMEKITAEGLLLGKEHIQKYEKYKDLERRFTWDILHQCDRNRKLRFFDKAYHEGLNDDHVYTAMKRIVKSFLKNSTIGGN